MTFEKLREYCLALPGVSEELVRVMKTVGEKRAKFGL